MERDFSNRVKDLAVEFFQANKISELSPQALIAILRQLAEKYDVSIEEKNWGVKESLANKRYQIWFNDKHSFEGGAYGESAESMEDAYSTVPVSLQITADIREVN